MFMTIDRKRLRASTYTEDEYGDDNFSVSMNEANWVFDDNNVLKKARCVIDGNITLLPVAWDEKGAYVENKNKRLYILEYCE